MSGYNLWGDDKLLMVEWIKENKDVRVSWAHCHPELIRLFPNRSKISIYNQWRITRLELGLPSVVGTSRGGSKKKYHIRPVKTIQDPLSFLSHSIESYVVYRLEQQSCSTEQYQKLQAENEELKGLLRKLTKVREAVESFQL